MDSRSIQRKPLLQQRQALSTDACLQAADQLLLHLQTWLKEYLQSKLQSLQHSQQQTDADNVQMPAPSLRVAGYLAIKGEIDLAPSLTWLRTNGHSTFLPIIRSDQNGRLLFASLTDATTFKTGRYQIQEPLITESDLLTTTLLDLVLVPLVGFDRSGNRLGMGGGYYDRTFSYKLESNSSDNTKSLPLLIGVAHDFQCLDQVPAESWDVPLDAVITDRAIYTID